MRRRILSLTNRPWSCGILLLSVFLLGGASFPMQSVMLTFSPLPENMLPLTGEGVIGELTDFPQKPLKVERSYKSAPLCGTIALGADSDNQLTFILDGNLLYLDSNEDFDKGSRQPLTALPAKGGLFRKTRLSFPPILVQLNYPENVPQEYRLAITCDLEKKSFSFVNLGYRAGTIIFLPPAKNLKAAIYDANPANGIFNNFGKDLLLVDLNRDGEFDISPGSPEKIVLAKTLSLAGEVYALEVMDSGEYLDIRQPSAAKQPSGKVAITYVIERDNKSAPQSTEAESAFRDGGFQVVCSRGPAKFSRGGSCKVFIRNGELMLDDPYSRPWKARFVGDSLAPAAVLTYFPSQFRIGFPLEQKLFTDKAEYRPGEDVLFSMQLSGQAKETYISFAPGEKSRITQPPGTDPNKLFFEESKPRLVIKDPVGKVVVEGDAVLKPPDRYRFTWRIPKETVIPEADAFYRATISWDTGPFQGVVTTEVQFSVVR